MSHAALHSARRARSTRSTLTDRVETTQRWAIGVLAVASVLLGVYLVLLVTATWLFASAWGGVTGDPVSLDLLSVAADVAPALLVGWCTGLATSAVLGRGEALGGRAAGLAAGAVGRRRAQPSWPSPASSDPDFVRLTHGFRSEGACENVCKSHEVGNGAGQRTVIWGA